MIQICARCALVKPASEFGRDKGKKNGLRSWCRSCDNEYNKERWRNSASMRRSNRYTNARRLYGLSKEEYDALEAHAGNACEVCGLPCNSGRQLAIDHDHATNRVRGLLCGNCNKGLGNFQDSPALLRKAIEYLESR